MGLAEHGRGDDQSAAGRGKTGPNPTDRGKDGVKRSLLTEGHGVPIGLAVAGANRNDMKLVRSTLKSVVVERPEPTAAQPQSMCLEHGELHAWEDLRRSDLERWLEARRIDGLAPESRYTELCDLRAFLKYVAHRGRVVDPNIFRLPTPSFACPLPKHLVADEFARLVKTVFAETAEETLAAVAARAWFPTLAHTGIRLNELLDLSVAEVDFAARRILICNRKGGHDCIAFG